VKGHVFNKNASGGGGERWLSWCWRTFDRSRGEYSVHHKDADCMHCLRALRDHALWKAQHYADLARDSTDHLESLRRARSRRATSRRSS